jgi:ATP diphosphatase
MNELERLELLMHRLRDPQGGCPWDRRQTMQTLVPHTLEEVYELVDAIEREDVDHLREELGDYLFQAAFYAQLAAENGWFTLQDVVRGLVDKLVERHPHVFPDGCLDGRRADSTAMDEATIKHTWEALKQDQRLRRRQHGALADVPLALPAVQRAQKLQRRAARVGFDWPNVEGVRCKLDEELGELDAAAADSDPRRIEHELGDLMFTCVNLARHHDLDAEQLLAAANRRFETRFAAMEAQARREGADFECLSPAGKEVLWERAKTEA